MVGYQRNALSEFIISRFIKSKANYGTQKIYCPTINRTYTLRNVAGQEVTCTQVFSVLDTIPPILILPDKHITCNENVPPYSNYIDVVQYGHGNQASDNCGNSALSALSFIRQTNTGSCPTIYERVYILFDRCGNSSGEVSEFIYLNDTIAPVIHSVPDDLFTKCLIPEPYADYGEFAAAGGNVTDECSFNMTHVGDSVVTSELIYRTYRFSDGCNYVDYVQNSSNGTTATLSETSDTQATSETIPF